MKQDHGEEEVRPLQLLGENEECTRTLCNLILTGRAVKYLHNGNVIYDKDGNLLVSTLEIKPKSDPSQVSCINSYLCLCEAWKF